MAIAAHGLSSFSFSSAVAEMTTAAEMDSLVAMMAAALAVATALASSSSYFFFAAAAETATTTQVAVAAANSFFSQTGGFHQSPCFHVFPIIPKLLYDVF